MDQSVFKWKRPLRLVDFRSRSPIAALGGPCPVFGCPLTILQVLQQQRMRCKYQGFVHLTLEI